MTDTGSRRRAGVLVPLFSIPSSHSWGVGEIADLPLLADWMREAGLSTLQLLPVNEMADGQTSPYSAMSAMAIDPIFIALRDVHEVVEAGGDSALDDEDSERLELARRAPTVDYKTVRDLKNRALRAAFESFRAGEWRGGGPRATAMRTYIDAQRWWLDDYALFRALHAENDGRYWTEWDAPIRSREPQAIAATRLRLEDDILYYSFLQWIAGEQWARAREACDGIEILGDFPFMVSGDSADVWSRQQEFRLDASVGVPPDAFSATGQDWGLPVYLWDVHEAGDYQWLRARARRCTDLFHGFRVDHLVGFFRTFVREQDGSTYFVPADESSQQQQGERILCLLQDSGAELIAEDLGVVPQFVRESLARLAVPGLKVIRWERDWKAEGKPFRDPAAYPAVSVAISGTHDTETVAEWWTNADGEERSSAVQLPSLVAANIAVDETFTDRLRDAVLQCLCGAGSDLVLVPMQDVFGWYERINVPAVVSDENWSWRLPWPVDDLLRQEDAVERAEFLQRVGRQTRRV
ncbi:4-alpha-glucanotransferase [soil metagenome]